MKPIPILCFALFAAFAVPPATAQSVQEFELPPGPAPTPTAEPQLQGPVDPESPGATRVRPAPEPIASPTTSAPPTEAPTPRVAEPSQAPTDIFRRPSDPAPNERSAAAAPANAPAQTPAPSLTPEAPASGSAPAPIITASPEIEAERALPPMPWAWISGALALLATLLGALVWWRRRAMMQVSAPQIEPPLVTATERVTEDVLPPAPASTPAPAPLPVPAPQPASTRLPQPTFGQSAAPALRIEAVPTHLTRSMMAASFACRLSLVNRGEAALENITVGLDMITAHASLPTSEQLADPARPLPEAGQIARIEPGESVEIAHEVRLPTSAIRTLRQGQAYLYVPLLRVRAQARDAEAVTRTFIVGTLPEAGAKKLQPFRLDEMPQTYRSIGLAALD